MWEGCLPLHGCAAQLGWAAMTDEIATPTPTRRRRRALLATGAVAVALAVAVTTIVLVRSSSTPHDEAASVLPVVGLPAPSPTSTPPATPPRHTMPHDYLARAAPSRFILTGHGFTIRAHVCAMAPVFPLDPPGEQHHTVCWVTKGFGVMPGSRSATTYVLGHAWAQDPLEVLNKVSARATRDVLHTKARRLDGVPIFPAKSLLGARITLRTPSGTLVYAVRNAFGVDKYQLGNIDSIMNAQVPRRVVLITCAERHGVDYPYNIVLDARLVSSRSSAGTSA